MHWITAMFDSTCDNDETMSPSKKKKKIKTKTRKAKTR